MREITEKIYFFNELSKESKEKAIENLSDINTSFDWWENVYNEASNIGCDIIAFDLGRSNTINFSLGEAAEDIAKWILEKHGKNDDSFHAATEFLCELSKLKELGLEEGFEEEEEEKLENELSVVLRSCYLNMLVEEYEYRISDKAIVETIVSNEYEFYENGKLYK